MTKSHLPTDWTVWFVDLCGTWGGLFLQGYFVMLTLGILHSEAKGIPALGFWMSVLVTWVLQGMVGNGAFNISQRLKALTPTYGKKVASVSPLQGIAERLEKAKRNAGLNQGER